MGSMVRKQTAKKICLDEYEFFHIKDKLCLDDENIQDLYEFFQKFDRFHRAYIDFDDFIMHFRTQIHNFVELPFAERLYKCIPKAQESKIFFEEFVQGISAFCLLNYDSLLHFIFDFIDIDGDERISKKDIMKLIKYTDPLNGK
jgi:Ca2+-binding EF-hand superfamily protein